MGKSKVKGAGMAKAKGSVVGKSKGKGGAKAKPAGKGGSKLDLGGLFGAALQTVTANRQEINKLDGYNGNHGDNMVQNLNLIANALGKKKSAPPAEALRFASQQIGAQGAGGTSRYYAQGLNQAADQFEGRDGLGIEDALPLIQTLLGAVPAQSQAQQAQSGGGSILEQILGLGGGQARQPQQQPAQDNALDVGDVVSALLPAGLTYLQAKQSGADTTVAAGQALISALASGQSNPLQTGSPRAAAGGLLAQGLLQALLKK